MTAKLAIKPSFAIASLLAAVTTLPAYANTENEGFSGNLRVGAITAEDSAGVDTDGSAIGGKFGYLSPNWNGLSAGATVYATQELFDDEEGSFFDSERGNYAILGEAFVQAMLGNSTIKAGRFELDSPHADTDDIRMIPNTFQGGYVANNDLANTTLMAGYLSKWAGVDTPQPEDFTNINGDEGVKFVGAIYEGIENTTLQGWYYQAKDMVNLTYLDAVYGNDSFEVGMQYGSQKNDTPGATSDAFGLMGSVNISDFTLSAAYNDVDGTITNGFGGGPFFTSADDHTIDGTPDESAVAIGVEYAGIQNLTLGVLNVDFAIGEDETDYYAAYEINESLSVELIHADMNKDGNNTRLVANFSF